MQKIPTMFVRDESQPGHPVIDQIKPECQWVLDGEGIATEKVDGTNVKIANGQLLKRQKPKARDYDEASYVQCDRGNPADRWAWEGFDELLGAVAGGPMGYYPRVLDGIYELIGPKVQGNPYRHQAHHLLRVVPALDLLVIVKDNVPRHFDGLREYLAAVKMEGIVFHHPDGRFAKIKRRDFGLPWPMAAEASR